MNLFQPACCFGGNQLGRVALELSNGFAVANKVVGVLVAGAGVVLSAHPMIESMFAWMREFRIAELLPREQMPLPDVTCFVADVFQQLRKGDLTGAQVGLVISRQVTIDAVSIGRPSSQNRGPGWRADTAGGIALRELHALRCQAIKVGRLNQVVSVGGGVAPAHVVGDEHHKVGMGRISSVCTRQSEWLRGQHATEQECHRNRKACLHVGQSVREVVEEKLHGAVNNGISRWIDVRVDFSPVVSRVSNDHDFDEGFDRVRFSFHVVSVLDWDGRVFVTLDHQQRRAVGTQEIDRTHLTVEFQFVRLR